MSGTRRTEPAGAPRSGVARAGDNCYSIDRASRLSFIADGEDYFAAVASACEMATDSIVILGWAIDSRVKLRPGAGASDLPDELGPYLAELVQRRKTLRVRVLAWDIGMVFGLESGFVPVFRTEAERRRRFQWELDSEHAFGAGQHQKIVVVDDCVAFVSGIDLTGGRWDTREHRPGDPRRVHAGEPKDAVHDVALVFDGAPARTLGRLVEARWLRATGKDVALARVRRNIRGLQPGTALGGVIDRVGEFSTRTAGHAMSRLRATRDRALEGLGHRKAPVEPCDRWPDGLEVQARDVLVALARTEARYLWHPAVREVEALALAAIASARRCVFFENQYFTSRSVTEAVAARLAEPDGPEVIIVQPLNCAGWLEKATMGVLRAEHFRRLRGADEGGRLRVLYPVAADGSSIHVHSKALIIDDEIARVGSANISNRSMSLDTELDAQVEACGRPDVQAAILNFRDGLVAEHLGASMERLREAIAQHGSLGMAIDALQGKGRSLLPLDFGEPGWLSRLPGNLADPEAPADARSLSESVLPPDAAGMSSWQKLRAAFVVGAILVLTAGWSLLPVAGWAGPETLATFLTRMAEVPGAGLLALALFLVAGAVAFPMSIMVIATVLAFGSVTGSLIALAGGMGSSLIGYAQGRVMGRRWLRRLGGSTLNRVSRALASHGVLTIAAARLLPFVPWTLTSLAAGASHVRPLDYVVGTLAGLVPAVLAAALLSDAATRPGLFGLVEVALFAALLVGLFAWGRARLRKTSGG